MIKLLIFDGGGTIWYSMDVLWEHYKAGFFYLGLTSKLDEFPYSLENCNELASLEKFNSRWNIAKALVALFFTKKDPDKILSSSDPDSEMTSIVQSCRENPLTGTRFEKLCAKLGFFLEEALYNYDESCYPACKNVPETLRQLHDKGFYLALLSNRRISSVEKILCALGIKELFAKVEAPILDEPEIKTIDPILKFFNVAKNESIFIGDSALDINSGKRFGLITVGVLSGMGTVRVLTKAKADYIISDIQGLHEIIEKINKGGD